MAPLAILLRFLLTLRGLYLQGWSGFWEYKLARNWNFRERAQNWDNEAKILPPGGAPNRDCTGPCLATWRFPPRNDCPCPSFSRQRALACILFKLPPIYALLLVPVQDFIRLFKVLIVLSTVLALFSLFIQVVDEHGERSQKLHQAKEKGSGKPTAIVNGNESNRSSS
jgi:hypothetical protein